MPGASWLSTGMVEHDSCNLTPTTAPTQGASSRRAQRINIVMQRVL
ncbi:MAG: hypothetical protein ACFWT0_04940 [Bifidobacterium crudilactis]